MCPGLLDRLQGTTTHRSGHVLANKRDEALGVGKRQDIVLDLLRASLAHRGPCSVVLELEPIWVDVVLLQIERGGNRRRALSRFAPIRNQRFRRNPDPPKSRTGRYQEVARTEPCLSLVKSDSMVSTTPAVRSSSRSRLATRGIRECMTGSMSFAVRSATLRRCPAMVPRLCAVNGAERRC